MKKILAAGLASACVMAFAATEAGAWQRKTTSTGPNGNSRSVESSGGCSGGSCTYQRSVTGPGGNTRTRSRTVTDGGDGDGWNRSRTVTGPAGNTYTTSRSGSCDGDSCSYERTRTGPNGSVTRSGTVSRY